MRPAATQGVGGIVLCGRTGKDRNTRTMFEGGGEAEYATGSARAMIEDGGEAKNATGPARNM